MQRRKLTSRSQKHGVKDLLPGMVGIEAPVWQSPNVRKEIKYLIQVSFEPVPA